MHTNIKKELGKKPKTLNKNDLIDLTRKVLSNLKKISFDEAKPLFEKHIGAVMITLTDGVLYFNDEAGTTLGEAVRLIKYDPLFVDVSRKTIQSEYIDFISRIFLQDAIDNKIKDEIESFLKKLRASPSQYRIFMPIEKLKLIDLAELKIGIVRLIPFSSVKKETKETIFIVPEDEGKIWGEIFVTAESIEAISKGQREIERVINFLRMYIPELFHEGHNKKIGLDKYDLKKRHYLAIKSNGSINQGTTNLGPFGDYILNEESVANLRKYYCFDEVSAILSKTQSSRTDLEKSITMAIRWLGLGVENEVLSEKFLNFAIALECLLIRRGEKGDKTEPISERAAFILGTTSTECGEIVDEVKLLYDIRSAIVHQGCEAEEEEIIKDSIPIMYYYSMKVLLYLAKRTTGSEIWGNIDDLASQITDKTFTR
jgi:hypothetical protein